MKIYDISKEVFSSTVFPGDPEPQAVPLAQIGADSPCALTQVTLGSHTGPTWTPPAILCPGAGPSTSWT